VNAFPMVALGELMATSSGSIDPAKFPAEHFVLYSIPAYDGGRPEVLPGSAIGSAKQIVEPGDVLLSRIVPHIRRSWVVSDDDSRRLIASGEWIVFRSERVYPRYLRRVLAADDFHVQFMRTVSGVGGSLLRARPAYVAQLKVPLPSMPEQRRIVDILDKADGLRVKRRAALSQLDSLTQSIFFDFLGDPVANPKRWPVSTLGKLLTFQQYGPRFYNESYSAEGVRIVRITDLSEAGSLDFSSMPRLAVSDLDRQKYLLRPDDLIFARTGATVGKVALIGPDDPPCIAGAYFITMRFAETIKPLYARAVLTAPSIRAIVAKQSRQAAQQNFSGPALRKLPMPLPPLELQHDFVRRVASVDKALVKELESSTQMDALFASLQYRAFRGEL
jgi:type I restriction enzyme, S subunit